MVAIARGIVSPRATFDRCVKFAQKARKVCAADRDARVFHATHTTQHSEKAASLDTGSGSPPTEAVRLRFSPKRKANPRLNRNSHPPNATPAEFAPNRGVDRPAAVAIAGGGVDRRKPRRRTCVGDKRSNSARDPRCGQAAVKLHTACVHCPRPFTLTYTTSTQGLFCTIYVHVIQFPIVVRVSVWTVENPYRKPKRSRYLGDAGLQCDVDTPWTPWTRRPAANDHNDGSVSTQSPFLSTTNTPVMPARL
jgi:hypothetical protein